MVKGSININPTSNDDWNEWLKLLFYKKTSNGHEGMADGKRFYLSENGKYDPLAELNETINKLNSNTWNRKKYKIHPQCVFPTRVRYLKKINKLKKIINCPELTEWKNGLDAKSLSISYSSEYAGNPSSMFGHVFIKVNKEKKHEVLDYTISFSALTSGKDWAPLYVLKGIGGGYPGVFEVIPYYQKIGEYNSKEGRDIFSYKLNLSELEVNLFLEKIWEFYYSTYFDYYFLTENCAGILRDVFSWLKPNWKFKDKWRPYYLPEDLIQDVTNQPNSIIKKDVRPSLNRKLETSMVNSKMNESKILLALNQQSKIKSENIDTLISYLQLKKVKGFSIDENSYQALLKKRSTSIYKSTLNSKEVQLKGPDEKSGSSVIGLGSLKSESNFYNVFKYRMGHHDFMDTIQSSSTLGSFVFLEINLLYNHKNKKLSSKNVKILEIISLEEPTLAEYPFSYFLRTILFEKRNSYYENYITGGVGKSYQQGKQHLSIYIGAQVGTNTKAYLSPLLNIMGKWNFSNNFHQLIEAVILYKQNISEKKVSMISQYNIAKDFKISLENDFFKSNLTELSHSLNLIKSF
jgi:hypothetical protein